MAEQTKRPPTIALGAALVGAALLVIAVIALGVGVVALLVGWFAGLPPGFVRAGLGLFGIAAIGLSIYALIQIDNAPADFFSGVSGSVKDSGLSDVLGQIGIDQTDVSGVASKIASVDYGAGVFVAMAGGVATVVAALVGRRDRPAAAKG